MPEALLVLSTVGSQEEARSLSRALVSRRNAACVNIVPGVASVYRWQGEICEDEEVLLVIKTTVDHFEAVASTIRELHSYDLPEVVAIGAEKVEREYRRWLEASVNDGQEDGS